LTLLLLFGLCLLLACFALKQAEKLCAKTLHSTEMLAAYEKMELSKNELK
jgi:hypothetical protein